MISDWVSRETVWCCGISYCLFVLFGPGVLLDESLDWDVGLVGLGHQLICALRRVCVGIDLVLQYP